MAWSFVLTQLVLNGKAGATLIWVAQGSILIHWWDVSMHNRFALFLQTCLQVSSSPTKKVQVSVLRIYSKLIWGINQNLHLAIFVWISNLGHDTNLFCDILHSSISLFLVTPCGQKFLAQHVTGMFHRRRAKTPKSKVGGEVSAGIGDGDLTNDWSTCVGETGKLEQMVQQNVMGCFVFWFGK